MQKRSILIVKTGSALPVAKSRFGDFEDWFARTIGVHRFSWKTIDVEHGGILPERDAMKEYSGVIITGSGAMVSHRLDWSERTARWLADVVTADALPVLGVCYGHQLLAHALGGRVGPNPHGRRIGTRSVEIVDRHDALLGELAPQTRFHVTHEEAVLEKPSDAVLVARADGDGLHALRLGPRAWGVQFHPEFSADIMRCYIEARAEAIDAEGLDSRALLQAVEQTPAGSRVLGNFADLCEAAVPLAAS